MKKKGTWGGKRVSTKPKKVKNLKLLHFQDKYLNYFLGSISMKKNKRGRPKLQASEKKEPTKVMRIRISKLEEVRKINQQ